MTSRLEILVFLHRPTETLDNLKMMIYSEFYSTDDIIRHKRTIFCHHKTNEAAFSPPPAQSRADVVSSSNYCE